MPSLMQLIEQYGLLLVFANVLVEQLGAPVPAVPTRVRQLRRNLATAAAAGP